MEIKRNIAGKTLSLTQTTYIRSIAKRFNVTRDDAPTTPLPPGLKIEELADSVLLDEHGITEYRAMVGSILYAVHCCRPSCAHAVHILSRKLHAPTKADFKLARGVLPTFCLPMRLDLRTMATSRRRSKASPTQTGLATLLHVDQLLGSFSLKIMPLYHGRLNCNQLSRTQQPTLNIAPSLKLVKRLCICARSNVL